MRALLIAVLPLFVVTISGCGTDELVSVPKSFPKMKVPADNAITRERVELGKRLFYDKQLSRTEEVACASCHDQQHAFADPRRVSEGVDGQLGTRNAPPLFNLAWNKSFFWDGGAPTLEHQVIGPLTNPLEMDMTMGKVVERLSTDDSYVKQFQDAYDQQPSPEGVTRAIASFMRTMVSGESRYDRYKGGDDKALNDQEKRGMDLFFSERAECFHCHVGFNFTNNGFHNNGTRPDDPDTGRERITESPNDLGKFKVPSLRNVAVTAPYMHDGSMATLSDVIDHYSRGGEGSPNTDPTIHPLQFSEQEKADLIAFLGTLTDQTFLEDPRFR